MGPKLFKEAELLRTLAMADRPILTFFEKGVPMYIIFGNLYYYENKVLLCIKGGLMSKWIMLTWMLNLFQH